MDCRVPRELGFVLEREGEAPAELHTVDTPRQELRPPKIAIVVVLKRSLLFTSPRTSPLVSVEVIQDARVLVCVQFLVA